MNYGQLITILIQAGAQYGPGLVKAVADLIHGNPQQQGETDDAYITRIKAQIDAKAADTTAADQQVIGSVQAPTPTPAPPPITQASKTTSAAADTISQPGGILNVG